MSGTPGKKRTPWLLPRMSITRLPPPSSTARLACFSLNGSLSHLVGKAQTRPWEDQVYHQSFSMGPRGGRSSRLQAGGPWGLSRPLFPMARAGYCWGPSACHRQDALTTTMLLSYFINCSALTGPSGYVKRRSGDGEAGMGKRLLQRTLFRAALCRGSREGQARGLH